MSLPPDAWIKVIKHVNSQADLGRLAAANRESHAMVQQEVARGEDKVLKRARQRLDAKPQGVSISKVAKAAKIDKPTRTVSAARMLDEQNAVFITKPNPSKHHINKRRLVETIDASGDMHVRYKLNKRGRSKPYVKKGLRHDEEITSAQPR
jgi:hypothetical protein